MRTNLKRRALAAAALVALALHVGACNLVGPGDTCDAMTLTVTGVDAGGKPGGGKGSSGKSGKSKSGNTKPKTTTNNGVRPGGDDCDD